MDGDSVEHELLVERSLNDTEADESDHSDTPWTSTRVRRNFACFIAVPIGVFLLNVVGFWHWDFITQPLSATNAAQETVSAALVGTVVQTARCHTAQPGETCFGHVQWALAHGIRIAPEKYEDGGLTLHSSFSDFQAYFAKVGYGGCKAPCSSVEGEAFASPPKRMNDTSCLCLFDVDRTLTGKQKSATHCPGTTLHQGTFDTAFGGGDLVVSNLGQNLQKTFCARCYLGVVSAGDAGSSQMKKVLQRHLPGTGTLWSGPDPVISPLVIGCGDAVKAHCAKRIVDWYLEQRRVSIPSSEVYFFDDRDGNTNGFAAMGFNAKQVSCNTRDGVVGFCGGLMQEVVPLKGIQTC